MAIDTNQTIEIRQSPWRMIGLIAIGFGFIALSLIIMRSHGAFGMIFGTLSLAFFGLCTIAAIWRLLMLRGPVITLSPRGIRDVRLSGVPIPWSVVRDIATWSAYNQPAIVLDVDPAYERTLKLTAMTRLTRGLNAAVGADGLCIASQGLSMGHNALLEAVIAYWQRYGSTHA